MSCKPYAIGSLLAHRVSVFLTFDGSIVPGVITKRRAVINAVGLRRTRTAGILPLGFRRQSVLPTRWKTTRPTLDLRQLLAERDRVLPTDVRGRIVLSLLDIRISLPFQGRVPITDCHWNCVTSVVPR